MTTIRQQRQRQRHRHRQRQRRHTPKLVLLLLLSSLHGTSGFLFKLFRRWCRFQIQLAFKDVPQEDQENYFQKATGRWEEIIRRDIPSLFINENPEGDCGTLPLFVDDLYVCFKYQEIDGDRKIIGSASMGIVREGGGWFNRKGYLPATGDVVLDVEDIGWIKEQGVFEALITHETGHLLGIGTRWLSEGLAGMDIDGCPYQLDSAASRAYQEISGCAGESIPIERDFGSGTRCKHWDEDCFRGELMTGKLSNTTAADLKISKMTIGTLEDIGYSVDYNAADDYTAADMNETCVCDTADGRRRRELEWRARRDDNEGTDETSTSIAAPPPPLPRRRQLSAAGQLHAHEYGKRVLQHRKQKRDQYRFSSSNQARYVGDELLRVFYVEDNEIFVVEVSGND